MCGGFNSYLITRDVVVKARKQNAGEVRIHLCTCCLCVDVRVVVFLGSLQTDSAANHPGLRLQSLFLPRNEHRIHLSRCRRLQPATFLSPAAGQPPGVRFLTC